MVGATAGALIGLMNPLLVKLSGLFERECDKLKGVGREVELLRDELSSMNTALEAVSNSEEPSSQVKEWMRQLRELSYDVEDCIDVFVHRLGQDDPDEGLFRRTKRRLQALRARHCVASQITELKERAVAVNDRRKRYKVDGAASSSSVVTVDSRLPALFEEMDRLVGIEGPMDELVEFLTGGIDLAPQRRVVSIVGFGGLGKTTLANQVYQRIKSQFDCTAFVSVSRNPNINKILVNILIGILETRKLSSPHQMQHNDTIEDLHYKTFEDYKLIDMIRKTLQNSRYFIVIDDIWSKAAWQDLQFAFPENNSASRIITTTRIKDVAIACQFSDEDYVYTMKPLSSENSKALFFRRIFCSKKEKCPPDLEEVADDILKKCDGMPLAVVSIASLLACKTITKQEWVWVLNSFGSTLLQDQGSHELAIVKRILFLSYCDLPHRLKTCFLHLGIVPEDYTITKEFLISRWIAEGFITEQRGQSLEEVGEKYFNELINRNMIQSFEIGLVSREEAYRVHDIMLDLIISLSTEENFATILDGQHCAPLSNKIRHLSLQCKSEEKISWLATASFSHARSLYFFGDFNKIPPLVDLQVVRVLDFMDCSGLKDDCIENIGSLSQLRYVRLGNVSKIPRQIGKLQFLQILDLRGPAVRPVRLTGTPVKELPESIVQLVKLVRLFMPWHIRLPNGIGNLKALEVLSSFDGTVNSLAIIQELGNLIKLKHLDICWDFDNTESGDEMYNNQLIMSLGKLGGFNLRSLCIQNAFRSSLDVLADSWSLPHHLQTFQTKMGCYFSSLPKWVPSLFELTCLTLSMNEVGGEDLQVLKNLPALIRLDLYPRESPKRTLEISCSGFSCLKEFSYGPSYFDLRLMEYGLRKVKNGLGMGLMFEAGAMPKLQRLEFGFNVHDALSAEGAGLDFGIQHLTSLRHVRVFMDCREASATEVDAAVTAVLSSVPLRRSCHPEICRIFEAIARLVILDLPKPPKIPPCTVAPETQREEDWGSVDWREREGKMVRATASALIGVINPLLTKLSGLLEREYDKLKGVGREVALLRDELSSMNTALEAVSESEEEPSLQVKEWMRQLRELSYDVEDCIDVFVHRLGHHDPGDGLFRRTKRRLKALRSRHCIASQIAELKNRAVVVNDRRKRYELDAAACSSGVIAIDSRLPALFEEMDRLVGIKGPRDELVEFLTGGIDLAQQRRVVSIVGFGGLGKTTLANQVYQHIKSQFDHAAFVSLSRNPNVNKILANILIGILETRKLSSVHRKQHSDTIEDLKHKTFEDCKLIIMIRENLQNSSIASLLSCKPVTKQEWVWVLNSFGSTVVKDQGSHELAVVKRILFLSYCNLPHHLKSCLLYLSIFPEDHTITREFLISRWIAEGFITEQRGESLEEVGEKYFNELINRNMGTKANWEAKALANTGPKRHNGCYFSRLPTWISSLSELTCITIRMKKVGEEDLQVLKCLPALLRLDLYPGDPKHTLKISCSGFSFLKEFTYGPAYVDLRLILFHQSTIKNGFGMGVMFEAGAMPKLQQLEFGFNAHDTHLTSLRHVRVFIDCRDASDCEMDAALAAITNSVSLGGSYPKLIVRTSEWDLSSHPSVLNTNKLKVQLYSLVSHVTENPCTFQQTIVRAKRGTKKKQKW
uniref:Uncharacterized protein n=1 Tax=Oryza punctata TaxID=4537 RepID=A0A0E0LV02_ORYPU